MLIAEYLALQPKNLVIEPKIAEVAAAYTKAGIPDKFSPDLQAALSQKQREISSPEGQTPDFNMFLDGLCELLMSWLSSYLAAQPKLKWWQKIIFAVLPFLKKG